MMELLQTYHNEFLEVPCQILIGKQIVLYVVKDVIQNTGHYGQWLQFPLKCSLCLRRCTTKFLLQLREGVIRLCSAGFMELQMVILLLLALGIIVRKGAIFNTFLKCTYKPSIMILMQVLHLNV